MVVRVDEQGRAVTDGPQVEIGGNERYVSVSRAEFKKIVAGEGRIELQQTCCRWASAPRTERGTPCRAKDPPHPLIWPRPYWTPGDEHAVLLFFVFGRFNKDAAHSRRAPRQQGAAARASSCSATRARNWSSGKATRCTARWASCCSQDASAEVRCRGPVSRRCSACAGAIEDCRTAWTTSTTPWA